MSRTSSMRDYYTVLLAETGARTGIAVSQQPPIVVQERPPVVIQTAADTTGIDAVTADAYARARYWNGVIAGVLVSLAAAGGAWWYLQRRGGGIVLP